jgi:putative acetyltransferase
MNALPPGVFVTGSRYVRLALQIQFLRVSVPFIRTEKKMEIRKPVLSDRTLVYSLYKEVAKNQGGIARLEEEITETYIEGIFKSVGRQGLMLIGIEEQTNQVIAEIHASKYGIRIFDHILTNLTIVVHPAYQRIGVGKRLFEKFLAEIQENRPDIGRVELESRATNNRSIGLYQSIGFVHEGRMKNKTRNKDGSFEDSILMAWHNSNFCS